MAIMRSAPCSMLSILSCLMLGAFFNGVLPSPPVAVSIHPLQGWYCKTAAFILKTIIYVDGDRDASSSTQLYPRPYKEVLDGSASSSNCPLNNDSAESGPLNPRSCKIACKKEVERHRDLLSVRPDICQVVITDEDSPAYTRLDNIPSTYDWVYTKIRWEDLSLSTSCLAPCVIDALAFDTYGKKQKNARLRFCTAPDFPDHHQCMCRTTLYVRRLLPEEYEIPDYGFFGGDGKGLCHEDNVFSRPAYNGWQPSGYQLIKMEPCLQKDDANWVPSDFTHIVIRYYKDQAFRASSSTLTSAEFILGYKHYGLPPFTYM